MRLLMIATAALVALTVVACNGDDTTPTATPFAAPGPVATSRPLGQAMQPVDGPVTAEGQYVVDASTGHVWKGAVVAWSADGRHGILNGCCEDNHGLDIVDMSSGNATRIVEGPVGASVWSTDGRKIAFAFYDGQRLTGPYVINADGSSLTRVPSGLATIVTGQPAWSADGKYLSFADQSNYLYVWQVGDDTVHKIASGINVAAATWSTAKTSLAYGDASGLHLYDPPTDTSQILITDSPDATPIWSPAGTLLAFAARRSMLEYAVLDVFARIEYPLPSLRDFVWSPDGQHVAYIGEPCSVPGSDIYIANSDGSAPQNLTDKPGTRLGLHWLADGHTLVYSELSPLVAYDTSVRAARNLVASFVGNIQPYSAGGTYVGFTVTAGGHGLCD